MIHYESLPTPTTIFVDVGKINELIHDILAPQSTLYISVPQSFLAGAPFSDKQISIAPLPWLAQISTQFFRAFHYKT